MKELVNRKLEKTFSSELLGVYQNNYRSRTGENKVQSISEENGEFPYIEGACFKKGFPGGSAIKNLPANIGDTGSTPGSGRSPGERNSSPLQYSCLENPLDREAWRATVHGVTKSQTRLGY